MSKQSQPSAVPPLSPARRVLIIDDEPDVTEVLVRVLESAGYDARALNDPRGIADLPNGPLPHLILLDMEMGALVGTEACMLLKRMPETRDIPVVFLSGLVSDDLRTIGRACGAAAYVTKSPDPAPLLAEIRRCLNGIETESP